MRFIGVVLRKPGYLDVPGIADDLIADLIFKPGKYRYGNDHDCRSQRNGGDGDNHKGERKISFPVGEEPFCQK